MKCIFAHRVQSGVAFDATMCSINFDIRVSCEALNLNLFYLKTFFVSMVFSSIVSRGFLTEGAISMLVHVNVLKGMAKSVPKL